MSELRSIYTYCLARLRHKEDAEDATGLVFTKALAAWSGVRQGIHPRPWLFRIACNVLNDMERSRRRALATAPLLPAAPGGNPEDVALESMEHLALWAQVSLLPTKQRTLIQLRFAAGLSLMEIAAAMGTSVGAVKTALWRALQTLRRSWVHGVQGERND